MKDTADLMHLLDGVTIAQRVGDLPKRVSLVTYDSREVRPGCMFVAVRGTNTDGHRYIDAAIEAGASVILCEELPAQLQPVCYVRVVHSEFALGVVAANMFDNPSRKLKLVGVTGTNGKTTVATLLYNLVSQLGHKAGLLSTVCYCVGEESCDATHTTPDAITLNRFLARMVEKGCEYAFMEVSSHAVVQQRIAGLHFAGGIFTNITHDHLDYHKTFAAYIEAKRHFFEALPAGAFALTNIDDPTGMVMVQGTRATVRTYSLRRVADYQATVKSHERGGMQMDFGAPHCDVWVNLIGDFNAYNLLAVFGAASELGFPAEESLTAISTLHPVPGRLDFIFGPEDRVAVVDYAHTPDALQNVLETLTQLGQGRLITVVGAGGDRDRSKRPIMGALAAKYSAWVYLTSDNPRSEEPDTIIHEMYQGVPQEQQARVYCLADRREAIQSACMLSRPGDIILVAGKGHETYQEVKGVRHHFDDREEVRIALQRIIEE